MKEICNHVDKKGRETVQLTSIGLGNEADEAYWECDQCGAHLTVEEELKLKLQDPAEAMSEALADEAERQRDYEASR